MKNGLSKKTDLYGALSNTSSKIDIWDTITKEKVFTGTVRDGAKFLGCDRPNMLYHYISVRAKYKHRFAIRHSSTKEGPV